MVRKVFRITDYLEVVLTVHGETVIYVNGQHFMQCSHVLTTVHTDEIENLMLLESVDEIKEAPNTIVIDPKTRFFVHCSNLQAWVENDFDTRMLHSNLSFPLLKKLVEEGCVSSTILKEEIGKRFEHGSKEMIRFLFEHEYLKSLSNEELSSVITPNFKELIKLLTGSVSKEDHQLLNYLLERSLNDELRSILKEELAKELEEGDDEIIRFLVDHEQLDSLSLSKEEISAIIPPNFKILLKDLFMHSGYQRAIINYILESSSNKDLKSTVVEELGKIIEQTKIAEKAYTLYDFYHRGYLEYFSNERLSAIIIPKFKRLIKDLFRDNICIDRDRGILGYLLGRSLNDQLKTIVKEEITEIFDQGDSRKIDILIKYGYLDFLSKEELSTIIKPNVSKIVKMDIDFKKYLFLLNKEDLSTVLTQDILHNVSVNILKSLPFEFRTVMKELIRRRFRYYKEIYFHNDEIYKLIYSFDRVFKELMDLKMVAPERVTIIKEEISKMLKKDSSTEFLDFLYGKKGGYFKLLNKDEFSAILTLDILHNISIKHITQSDKPNYPYYYRLPLEYDTRILLLLRRYDVGNDKIKKEIRSFFMGFLDYKEHIFYDSLWTLFKRYEIVDNAMKNTIRKCFKAILDTDGIRDVDKFKSLLGRETLQDMLTTMSMKDILHFRYDHKMIDLQMYKREVSRRFKSKDSDLRNVNNLTRVSDLGIGDSNPIFYEIMDPFSKSELLQMIPKKFHKIKNIIKKLDLNFKIDELDHNVIEDDTDDEFQNLFIFSVNTTEDLVKITIQNYPDLSKNLNWILSELGKIKDVEYIIELWNDDVSTLPTSIPNIPIIKLIIDDKIVKNKWEN